MHAHSVDSVDQSTDPTIKNTHSKEIDGENVKAADPEHIVPIILDVTNQVRRVDRMFAFDLYAHAPPNGIYIGAHRRGETYCAGGAGAPWQPPAGRARQQRRGTSVRPSLGWVLASGLKYCTNL